LTDAAERPSPTLIDVLRSTLLSLEQSREAKADDPALQEFKRSLLRLIADLQLRKETKSGIKPKMPKDTPQKKPGTVLTLIVKPGGKAAPGT